MCITFDKLDGFIRIFDGTRYLTLLDSEIFNAIYDKIRYLQSLKSRIAYIFSNYFAKTKVDSSDYLLNRKNINFA